MRALVELVILVFAVVRNSNCTPTITIVLAWSNLDCIGGDNALLSTGLLLKYTSYYGEKNYTNSAWVAFNSTVPNLDYYPPGNTAVSPIHKIQFIFHQPEHGGGPCHCVSILFIISQNFQLSFSLCGEKAEIPRERCVEWFEGSISSTCVNNTTPQKKEIPFQMNYYCRHNPNILAVSFEFTPYCKGFTIDNSNSLELSIRLTSSNPSEWIPILIIVFREDYFKERRQYKNIEHIVVGQSTNVPMNHHIKLCNFSFGESVQFRWLLTSTLLSNQNRDVWSLDNIEIIQNTTYTSRIHLNESFCSNSIDNQNWKSSNIRNGNITTCADNGDYELVFGENIYLFSNGRRRISSHSVLTDIFSLQCESDSTVTAAVTPVEMSLPGDVLSVIDETIRTKVLSDSNLVRLLNGTNVTVQLYDYGTLLEGENETIEVFVYVFAHIFKKSSDSYCEPQIFLKVAKLSDKIISLTLQLEIPSKNIAEIIGPTLLFILDQFVLTCVNPLEYSSNENVAIVTKLVNSNMSSIYFSSSKFNQWTSPYVEVIIPTEELQEFAINGYLRTTFSVFRNISSILPNELNGFQLVSDVIGISLRCNTKICPTDNITLDNSVRIIFHHSNLLKNLLVANQALSPKCAFLQILHSDTLLKSGKWSSEGCNKNEVLSSPTATTCECTHLTHFGILLSAKEIHLARHHKFSLSIVGYIGIGISCVAMLCTIICFIAFKTFHNMRTYIHANLCINLAIAQLLFVTGIDRTGDPVPVHCQVIAVLLQYFFLVSFMWMLMEGVFLYFALVKVFIANPKKYIIFFTAISYGLPLVYMGFLTLPLGFGFSERQYGYLEACFLKTDSHFIWAFISPVIIIVICNSIFLIMAAIIMWKQERKRDMKKESHKVFKWIKAVTSLTVVMGLTWIIGVLIVEREELLPLAYIYTIMVAFQGFFIFLVLVVFTTSVHDQIRRWAASKWKTLRTTSSDTNSTVLSNLLSLKKTPVDVKTKSNQGCITNNI